MDLQKRTSPVRPSVPTPPRLREDQAFDLARPPPQGGLPLGTVLGVTISVLVALVLGALTALQLQREEHRERAAREALLGEAVAPLADEIEQASKLDEIERLLSSTESAEIARGRFDFNLMLFDGEGRVVSSTSTEGSRLPPADSLQASVAVRSALLPSERGTLTVWQDASGFLAEMKGRRRSAWFNIAVIVVVAVLVVQLSIYFLVTRPLNRLLLRIEKAEQGYPVRLRQDDIARELRWLEWQFHSMGVSLANSARLLVAAHRRATEASKSRSASTVDPRVFDPLARDRGERLGDHDIIRWYLRDRCALIEGASGGDPKVSEIARQVWDIDAAEAARIGEMELCVRLENAAFRVLDKDAFARIHQERDALVAARDAWCVETAHAIETALVADGVSLIAVQHRAKHVAGIWRKMRVKDLSLEDVHDVFAFRIIAAENDDCYLALNTVHRLFEPEPFRFKDYISSPKPNGYQSLHTSVRDRDGLVFEVQIRSLAMHRAAENGDAAHWRYHASRITRVAGRTWRPFHRLVERS
jgi:hypothetical protein